MRRQPRRPLLSHVDRAGGCALTALGCSLGGSDGGSANTGEVSVDRHGVVASNELHIGVFGRDNLGHASDPDRAVQHADALHLEHQLVLREIGILGLEPVQALRRTEFLDIEKLEEVLEMVVPFANVCAYEGANRLRAPGVDIAE